jgi:hypothetical protein
VGTREELPDGVAALADADGVGTREELPDGVAALADADGGGTREELPDGVAALADADGVGMREELPDGEIIGVKLGDTETMLVSFAEVGTIAGGGEVEP